MISPIDYSYEACPYVQETPHMQNRTHYLFLYKTIIYIAFYSFRRTTVCVIFYSGNFRLMVKCFLTLTRFFIQTCSNNLLWYLLYLIGLHSCLPYFILLCLILSIAMLYYLYDILS